MYYLFQIGGLTLLVVGLWVAVSQPSNQVANIIETNLYKAAAYILFIAGTCVVAISLIGCCGTKFESRCLLGTYFVFLLFVFILELIAGIIALACYTQAEGFIKGNMEDSLKMHYGSKEAGKGNITEGWDYVQNNFKCCGVDGNATVAITTYSMSEWFKGSGGERVPDSCCKRNDDDDIANRDVCVNVSDNIAQIYDMGCYQVIRDKVIQYATILAGLGIAVCTIQIFGMIFACCLFRQLI
ncbi:hypothetical protein BSL78_14138 [Apostichopus japonicus]|uniref:Tetraspanin n=1 Tax=Stichopus japonicus TaxID=307972 RepID=A0A2G8KLZ3_STIJA|nr:hypothetical protein BSL78_14138 [Apostichopus japonicus]